WTPQPRWGWELFWLTQDSPLRGQPRAEGWNPVGIPGIQIAKDFYNYGPVAQFSPRKKWRKHSIRRPSLSPLFNARIRVVIVDALEILGLDPVPGHPRVRVQPQRHVAHQIFHEHRVFVYALRDRFLVLPLEQ